MLAAIGSSARAGCGGPFPSKPQWPFERRQFHSRSHRLSPRSPSHSPQLSPLAARSRHVDSRRTRSPAGGSVASSVHPHGPTKQNSAMGRQQRRKRSPDRHLSGRAPRRRQYRTSCSASMTCPATKPSLVHGLVKNRQPSGSAWLPSRMGEMMPVTENSRAARACPPRVLGFSNVLLADQV